LTTSAFWRPSEESPPRITTSFAEAATFGYTTADLLLVVMERADGLKALAAEDDAAMTPIATRKNLRAIIMLISLMQMLQKIAG